MDDSSAADTVLVDDVAYADSDVVAVVAAVAADTEYVGAVAAAAADTGFVAVADTAPDRYALGLEDLKA